MIRADKLEPGKIYRPTRATTGLNTYYLVLDDKKQKRLMRRLGAKPLGALDPDEARVYFAIKLHNAVAVEMHHRFLSHGERVERKSFVPLKRSDDVALRAVKQKPGYT